MVHQTGFRVFLGLLGDDLHPLRPHDGHGAFHEVADDGIHIAAHIAHFGEFRRFHLYERRVDQFGQTAGDLGFPHAGGADHDDVFRNDVVSEGGVDIFPTVTVAQSDGHAFFGVGLPDDIFIQFHNDLTGGQFFFFHEGSPIFSTMI